MSTGESFLFAFLKLHQVVNRGKCSYLANIAMMNCDAHTEIVNTNHVTNGVISSSKYFSREAKCWLQEGMNYYDGNQ